MQPVEVCHQNILLDRHSYEVSTISGHLFNPSSYTNYKEAFSRMIDFWRQMYRENDTLIEIEILAPQGTKAFQKDNGIRARFEIFLPDKLETIIRRVDSLEGVLDCHSTLAAQFTEIHPEVGVWCYPEDDLQLPIGTIKRKEEEVDFATEWINVCRGKPNMKEDVEEYERKGYVSQKPSDGERRRWFDITCPSTQDTEDSVTQEN